MQVFKVFFKVLWKGHKVPIIIYTVIFLVLAFMFAYMGSDGEKMFEQTELNICFFDEDNSAESRSLIDFIGENNNVVSLENDNDVIIDALYYKRVDCVLTIKKGYSENLASGNTDKLFEMRKMHSGYSEILMDIFLEKYISAVSAYISAGENLSDAVKNTETALSEKAEINFADFNENDSSVNYTVMIYFRYLSYILLAVLINTLSDIIIEMNKKDMRFRTDCSGIRSSEYTFLIFAGSIVFVLLIWFVFMLVGMYFTDGIYSGKMWFAVLNSLIFAVVSAAIAIFISCFSIGGNVITFMTQIISLGMSFLCGVFVDQSLLSEGVLNASRFLPAYWYVKVNDIILNGSAFDASEIISYLFIECGFAGVFILLTILLRKYKYKFS